MERRSYAGGANQLTLQGGFTSGDPTFVTDAPIGWPDGTGGPFSIRINRGGGTEEKLLISSRSGSTFTIATHGYDGTGPGKDHSATESVELVGTSIDLDEANAHHMASDGIHGLAAGVHLLGDTSVATVRNKTIDGGQNTLQNIPRVASPQTDAKLTALDAANTAQDVVTASKVPLGGGAMSGLLVLSADPTTALGATTRQYVDAADATEAANRAAADNAEATARTAGDALAVPASGGTMTGPLVLPGDPTTALQAATKGYVDNHDPVTGVSTLTPDANGNVSIPHGAFTPSALLVSLVGPSSGNASAAVVLIRALGNPTSTVRVFDFAGVPIGSGGVTIHWAAYR